ncbi:allantoinase PuuE [Microbacterium pseudoresistens]|uniref:Peptidoglycan/xylan/chitin deacetylase (PgdA/CDA1 family) n=1 Tax=Microbacterium pseudoresistens TaxID=640634 RepID=A0A7Y9JMF3_9MICO|nr:polysaccharide deacetylase family protein [Microbacterium pseudoresistens]NYD54712.1 peptidoglycan/xylan/chitin deacetylase (PgdA/CDA1 family) [Microbacterium pseudoresistens]
MAISNDRVSGFEDEPGPGPVRDLYGHGRNGIQARWPGGKKVAVPIVVNFETGAEASWPSGDRQNDKIFEFPYGIDDRYRDLPGESVSEYGSRAGIWRMARLFDEYDIKTTISGCAVAFARNPEVGAYVQEAGHEPGCHGWRWEYAHLLDRREEQERMQAAIQIIEETCGSRPVGWQSRTASMNTRELVVEEGGFLYDSDAINDDVPYFVTVSDKKHLVIPYSPVYNDHRFVIGQGYSEPEDYFKTLKHGFDYLRSEGETHGKMMTIGVHAHWIGQASRASALKMFIEYALGTGDVWFAPRSEIAKWWIENSDSFATN